VAISDTLTQANSNMAEQAEQGVEQILGLREDGRMLGKSGEAPFHD
jgi:hypothetical protein